MNTFGALLRMKRVVALAGVLCLPGVAFAQAPAASAPPAAAVPASPAVPSVPAPQAEAPLAAPPGPAIAVQLPHNLSPWGMFVSADIVVKAVMVGLVFASLLTWTIWFAKAIELALARRRLRRALDRLSETRSLADALARLQGTGVEALALARAAEIELTLSADTVNAEGIKERIASRLSRLEAAAGRRMMRGTGLLATIGATAPFVGLFGTVWGIMNSFIGISQQQTTNLAVVAPGIAEALLATALGLIAAIPAVVMYNLFARWIAGFRAQQADCAAEILRLVSRDLDRDAYGQRQAERRHAAAAE